jgi:hypothetical protein
VLRERKTKDKKREVKGKGPTYYTGLQEIGGLRAFSVRAGVRGQVREM